MSLLLLNGDIVPEALAVYVDQNIDFTDAIIGVRAAQWGAEYAASFDRGEFILRCKQRGIQI